MDEIEKASSGQGTPAAILAATGTAGCEMNGRGAAPRRYLRPERRNLRSALSTSPVPPWP
jgi:hypothetical protein